MQCGTALPRLFVYELPKEYHMCIDQMHLLDSSGFPRVLVTRRNPSSDLESTKHQTKHNA